MSKTNLPTYIDGKFHLFSIHDTDDTYSQEQLVDEKLDIWFEELSVFDKLKFDLSSENIEITTKLRIDQYKKINSRCVVCIDGLYHKVYNAAHFRNKDGFLQTDLTLEVWNGSTEVTNEKE